MESYLKDGPTYQSLDKRNGIKMPLIQMGKAFCNYFPLKVTKFQDIYIFSIELIPHIPVQKFALRYRVLSLLQIQIARVIIKPVITGFQIYSQYEPKANEKIFQSGEYKVQVKLKKVVKISQNPNFLRSVLQSFIRGLMIKKNFNIMGKTHKYFNMKNKVQHYAVNVYSGFHVDFVKSQKLFYLRIDSSRKIVSSQTALDAIEYYHRACRGDRQTKRKFIREKMIGRTVMANYGKNRFFKIKNIQFKILQEERLQDHKPLIQYYEQKYGINIKTPTQPLIVVQDRRLQKQKKKCYLIPELCFMIGLPDDIQEVKQRNILTAMKLQPQQSRLQSIQMMEDLIQSADDWKNLQKLGIFLQAKEMPLIQYKKFPKPIISLGSKLTVERGLQTLFNIACRPIYDGSHQIYCTIIHFTRANLTGLQEIFQKNSKDIGVEITFQKFDIGQVSNKALVQIESSISKICQENKMSQKNSGMKKTNFVLLIVPNSLKIHYRKIKKICLINNQILSQLVFQSTLNHRHNVTIFGKILLQIIAKKGNILWRPQQIFQTDRKIILIAFSTSKVSSENILGTCCTLNETYQVGYSCVDFCSQNNQKSNDLLEIMIKGSIKCLEKYKKVNKVLPDEIIFLSKAGNLSIGDRMLKQKFIQGLWIQINEFYQQQKEFCMTYILIETKDNSKFFILDNVHTKARNAQIGTFFDKKIVQKNEFLLITHATPGVSAVPIRFKILTSDSNLQKSMIQQLLFNQCFNYANHTGLVQTPAILQYAKKCAKFRAQAPFQEQLTEQLQQVPYYL